MVCQACLTLLTRFPHRLGQYFIDERLVQFPFFLGVSRNHDSTFASKRIAMSFLGSSPTVGRPTRLIRESCLSESSGISEKSIFFDFIFFYFSFRLARRADNPRDFIILILA